MQRYSINQNPLKRYKRFRLKWFLLFLLLGSFIIWTGVKEKIDKEPEKPDKQEQISEPGEPERNDFQYLKESPDIRVILQAGTYEGLYHSVVEILFPSGGYILTCQDEQWEKDDITAGTSIVLGHVEGADYYVTQDMLVAAVSSDENIPLIVKSIERNREVCSYYGRLEVTLEKGGFMIINALSLEQYLCSVVPSEMPASYEEEALKAQAILARTYAYKYLIDPAYPEFGAHVDDSIAFQVYGNIDNNPASSMAVSDTSGILLFSDKSLAEVYYYSTSCGYGCDGTAWGGEGQLYLQAKRIGPGTLKSADNTLVGKEAEEFYLEKLKNEQVFRNMIASPFVEGYEAEESWYRWSAVEVQVNEAALLARMKERYAANPNVILTENKSGEFVSKTVKKLGEVKNIYVAERGAGGVCKSLIIEGTESTFKILQEYNIRYVLNGAGTTVIKADGNEAYCATLLPSAFFYLDTVRLGQNVISYNIYGGGYGHGVGMSQNGANRMAQDGLNCQDILELFFPETVFVSYETGS